MSDWELLNQYVRGRSEAAFGRLVELHAGMVYAVCKRRLHDAHLAEDATQAVFMVLAARAKSLRVGALAGWLHQTARYVADRAARHEQTRRRHEQKAAEEQPVAVVPDSASDAADLVDQMLSRLASRDKSAIVLRYLEGREPAEIAAAMQLSEEAARKRITRALGRLRMLAGTASGPATIPALETVLHSFHSSAVAPSVVARASAAALGHAKGIQATLFAKEVIKMIVYRKLQLAALTAISIIAVTGGATALLTRPSASSSVAAAAPPPAPQTAPAAKLVNARAAMGRTLPAATFNGVGFADVTDFLKDISGVPILVDWIALEQVGVNKNVPVSLNMSNASFDRVLNSVMWAVAEPGKLDYAVHDNYIEISIPSVLKLPPGVDQTKYNEQMTRYLARSTVPDLHKLGSALDMLSRLNRPIWVDWESLKKAGVKPDTAVDATKLAGMPLPAALEALLLEAGPKAGLQWTFRDDMILISTAPQLAKIKSIPYVNHNVP